MWTMMKWKVQKKKKKSRVEDDGGKNLIKIKI